MTQRSKDLKTIFEAIELVNQNEVSKKCDKKQNKQPKVITIQVCNDITVEIIQKPHKMKASNGSKSENFAPVSEDDLEANRVSYLDYKNLITK